LDLRRTARVGLGLIKSGPPDLGWTAGIGWLASVPFSNQQRRRRPHPRRRSSPETRARGLCGSLGRPEWPGRLGKARGIHWRGLGRERGTGGGRFTAKRLGGGVNQLRRGIKRSREQYKGREGRERFLTSRRAPGTPQWRQWRDGGPGRRWRTSAAARRTASERGQREIGRGRGNWGASRVADVEAKLTMAESTAELQRRRGNGLGRRWLVAAALWRARSEGEAREGSVGAQMREGERASGVLGSSGRGRGGCELHARRGRGVRGSA
jgi:hypothetical protein